MHRYFSVNSQWTSSVVMQTASEINRPSSNYWSHLSRCE